jgi:hypothetical protein
MSVHVDEARAKYQPGGIEHFSCGLGGKARFDRRDSPVRDAHVGSKHRAVSGEDQGSFDQKVERHCLTPMISPNRLWSRHTTFNTYPKSLSTLPEAAVVRILRLPWKKSIP